MQKKISSQQGNSKFQQQHSTISWLKILPRNTKIVYRFQSQISIQEKKKLFNWMRILTTRERVQKFTFKNKTFVTLLKQMFYRKITYNEQYFTIYEETKNKTLMVIGSQKSYQRRDLEQLQVQQKLINNIFIFSQQNYNDSMGLSYKFWFDIEAAISLLENYSKQQNFYQPIQSYRSNENFSNQYYFYIKNDRSCRNRTIKEWICKILKYIIWAEYYQINKENINGYQSAQIKNAINNKKWNQLTVQKKRRILKTPNQKIANQKIAQLKHDPRINHQEIHPTEILKQAHINQFVQNLNLINSYQISKQLTSSYLQDSIKIQNYLLWIIFKQIESKLQQPEQHPIKKRKKNKKKKKNSQHILPAILNTIQKSVGEISTQHDNDLLQDSTNLNHNKLEIQIQKQQSENMQVQIHSPEQGATMIQNVSIQKLSTQGQILQKQLVQQIEIQKSNSIQQTVTQVRIQQIKSIEISKQVLQSQYNHKLESDIQQIIINTQQSAFRLRDQKLLAFYRIKYLLNMWNYNIKLFGSFATGLDLEDSDVDLALEIPNYSDYYGYEMNREYICYNLQWIYNLLIQQNWVQNLQFIPSASIPILKFQINPNASYEQYFQDPNLIPQMSTYYKNIKFDLTIEYIDNRTDNSHFGEISTNYIKQWLVQYPSLYQVCMLLKLFMKKKKLDNSYTGGLNNFCIILMIIAYLRHKNLCKETNIAKVFYGFLQYYTVEFQNTEYGIDINSKIFSQPFFQIPSSRCKNIEIKSPFTQKIITQNAHQYCKIIQQFKNLKNIKTLTENMIYENECVKELPQYDKIFEKNYLKDYLNQE